MLALCAHLYAPLICAMSACARATDDPVRTETSAAAQSARGRERTELKLSAKPPNDLVTSLSSGCSRMYTCGFVGVGGESWNEKSMKNETTKVEAQLGPAPGVISVGTGVAMGTLTPCALPVPEM
eukprot:Amastigsp_a842093_34.p3 type:complete len:125 gc:universal Amastigsp_a842093_34:606-232(-)